MAAKVETINEISLNGVYYPLSRPVQTTLASVYPSKVVIGDTTKDSQVRTSVIAWSDWRGGIGVERMDEARDVNRAWWSDLQLRFKNHLVLGNYANITSTPSHGLSTHGDNGGIAALQEFDNKMYVVFNGQSGADPRLYVWNETQNYWFDGRTEGNYVGQNGSDSFAVSEQVTDSVVFTKGTTDYFVLAHQDATAGGYSYATVPSYDGSSNAAWTNDTQDTKFLATWDDRLWGISNSGQLWFALTPGSETLDAKLPLPDGYVTALFVGRDSTGEPILFVATKKGLFAHDSGNSRLVETEISFPLHPHGGRGTQKWRDSIYYPSGLGLYRYINGANQAVVTPVGPDRDDGLKSGYHGQIKQVVGSHNELMVGVDSLTAPEEQASDKVAYQWASNHTGAHVIQPSTGLSSILGYNELGWEVKWVGGTEGRRLGAMTVSNAYSSDLDEVYRLWWGYNDIVYWQKIPSNLVNPSQITDFEYAATGTLETPWFNANQSEISKLALNLKVEVQDASSTEKVKVEYATNYGTSYTEAGSDITSDGTTTFTFGSGAGITFRSIKFRLTLYRATATASDRKKTPDVVSMTLEWRKKLTPRFGFACEVSLNDDYKGKSPKELRAALVSAIQTETLLAFTFRDDSGGTRNYYVDVASVTGLEHTGYDERGTSTITLVEP